MGNERIRVCMLNLTGDEKGWFFSFSKCCCLGLKEFTGFSLGWRGGQICRACGIEERDMQLPAEEYLEKLENVPRRNTQDHSQDVATAMASKKASHGVKGV